MPVVRAHSMGVGRVGDIKGARVDPVSRAGTLGPALTSGVSIASCTSQHI